MVGSRAPAAAPRRPCPVGASARQFEPRPLGTFLEHPDPYRAGEVGGASTVDLGHQRIHRLAALGGELAQPSPEGVLHRDAGGVAGDRDRPLARGGRVGHRPESIPASGPSIPSGRTPRSHPAAATPAPTNAAPRPAAPPPSPVFAIPR